MGQLITSYDYLFTANIQRTFNFKSYLSELSCLMQYSQLGNPNPQENITCSHIAHDKTQNICVYFTDVCHVNKLAHVKTFCSVKAVVCNFLVIFAKIVIII